MKKITALLMLAALLSTLAACTDAESDTSDTTTTAATTTATPTKPEIPGDTILDAEEYNIDFSQYMTIPDLATVKGSQADFDEIWNEYASEIRREFITLTDAEEGDSAEINDEVNIHYKGYSAIEDVVFSETTLSGMNNFVYDDEGNLKSGYDLLLGSNSFIVAYESEEHPEKNNLGFEEQLVGMKVGETRTITVTFPDNYGKDELNGAVVKFDVTVNSLKKGTLPELTDQMVAEYYYEDLTSIEELENELLSYYAYGLIFQAFTVNSYPEEILDSKIAEYVADYIESMYEEELTDEEAQTVFDEQYNNAKAYAESIISERMVLEYLFDLCDISMTQAEFIEKRDAEYDKNAEYYYYYYGIASAEDFEEAIGKDEMVVQFKEMMLRPLLADLITIE